LGNIATGDYADITFEWSADHPPIVSGNDYFIIPCRSDGSGSFHSTGGDTTNYIRVEVDTANNNAVSHVEYNSTGTAWGSDSTDDVFMITIQ
jgi:hypothetical protein